MTSHRTGLLIIRVWLEAGSEEPLRAKIRLTDDVSVGIERTLTLARPGAVEELVNGWLRGMMGDPADLTETSH